MVQLRKEARKRKKVHLVIATAHLSSVEYEDVSFITPTIPLYNRDNRRWYRNRLTNDSRELDFKSNTTTVKVCDNHSKIDSLRKKLNRRWLNLMRRQWDRGESRFVEW